LDFEVGRWKLDVECSKFKTAPRLRLARIEGRRDTYLLFHPLTRQEHGKMGEFFRFTRQITRQKAFSDLSGGTEG
jgi:hypothetical protein